MHLLVLLMAPVAYHRIVDRGENRADLNSLVLAIMRPTLPLFALSMSLTLYIATEKLDDVALAAICRVTGAGLALMLWYGEARMVLPGAQALLGFQFVTMVLDDFDRLPESSKQVHLISLLATALSTVLLVAPAAYHRIVEQGANTEAFHRLAGRY